MILEVGKLGILEMKNSNTSNKRTAMIINKDITSNVNGGLIMLNDKTIEIGYNEKIVMESNEKALALLKIINAIIVHGDNADNTITDAIETIEQVFFQ